ncbi:hypothetical protein [Nocardioides euryhalodurans]|uniref:Uncharacterized protein n=1 Tax=Nocardioides euryhalodurans TaxID=2518370 RepID=A0A4P7GKA9_9ACTN|nr:hypothetical protein [Nocardioides euryhalodurans]QBR92219.1 hypothetical protein EXE57_07905 [Nocardioides euryhalodurans]
MSDQQTPDPQPTTDPTPEGAADPTEPAGSRRDRFRARSARFREGPHRISRSIAVALASGLIIGGAGGFAVAAVTTDGPDHGGPHGGPHGRPFDAPHEDEQRRDVPPGTPGELPPSTPPEDSGDLAG